MDSYLTSEQATQISVCLFALSAVVFFVARFIHVFGRDTFERYDGELPERKRVETLADYATPFPADASTVRQIKGTRRAS